MKKWAKFLGFFLIARHLYSDRYNELCEYLDSVYAHHSNIVKIDTIGQSVEGRNILAVKISDAPEVDEDEPELLIEGGTHGNELRSYELIAPYFIDYLTDNYGEDTLITRLVNTREIWFIPMVNPDGIVDAQRNNANGVNLNRDYGYMWDNITPFPFSQPETQAMREFFKAHQFVIAVSQHTGANSIGYAWSATREDPTDNVNLDTIVGGYATRANPSYSYGQAADIIYPVSGSSKDFYYGTRGAMSWTIELGPQTISELFERNKESLTYLIDRAGWGIRGKITNSSGTPIEAMIIVENFYPAYSDPLIGDYHKFVVPGTYNIKVWSNGYEKKIITGVNISQGEAQVVDVELEKNNKYYAFEVIGCNIENIGFLYKPLYTPYALGIVDSVSLSLGRNGWIILDMGVNVVNQSGADFKVYEGIEDGTSEEYIVYVSNNPVDTSSWVNVGSGNGTQEFDLSGSGYSEVKYIKIVDDNNSSSGSHPGFDLDAVENLSPVVQEDIEVVIYDTTGGALDSIDIPIWINGELGGRGIIACDIILTFDSTIIEAIEARKGEIIPSDWNFDYNASSGRIKIEMYGDEISGSGEFVVILFKVKEKAEEGDTTVIHFQRFWFNGGNIPVITRDGVFRVEKVGVEEKTCDYESFLFLNPCKEIKFGLIRGEVKIYDYAGRIVYSREKTKINNLSSGIYFYSIKGKNFVKKGKLIVIK